MRLKIIFICFFGVLIHSIPAFAQVMWQITSEKVTKWNYLDGDEFNGTSLDTSKWRDDYPWARSLYCTFEDHYYTPSKNFIFNNGILSLVAKKETVHAKTVPYESDSFRLICDGKDVGANFRKYDYTSGMIFSKQKYHYGYYEIKFKSQEGSGIWPAFWLYAGHDNDEIDVFEMNGSRNSDMHVDVHCKSGCKNYKTTMGLVRKNWGGYLKTSGNWKNGYNIISIEWQPGYIRWFLNGETVAWWKGKFDYPMWVIANLALARNDGPFGPGPDATTVFPAYFDIDYIRIWSTANSSAKRKAPVQLEISATNFNNNKAVLVKGTRPESKKKLVKEKSAFLLFAPAGNNKYILEITGTPPASFLIEVMDESGKPKYKSTNGSQPVHEIKIAGGGKLKINVGSSVIEHSF